MATKFGCAGIGSRRAAQSPAFQAKIRQMRLTLAPLVKVTTGEVHPDFPATFLGFWLLTDDQLESMASFYHQRSPSFWTYHYPCPIQWQSDLSLEEKRRKIGKFIGLRGCDSPPCLRTADEIRKRARRARIAEDETDAWRRKLSRY